jgi:hypothetical protein
MKTMLDMNPSHRTISGEAKLRYFIFSVGVGALSLEEYNSPRPCLDNIGKVESLAGREFHHEEAIKDHWMNATNDYNVHIRDYCRMNLYLAEKALRIAILEEVI